MTLFLTHTDLDGVSSYLIASYFNIPIDMVHFINYDELYDKDQKMGTWRETYRADQYDTIYVADLAVTPEMLEWMKATYKSYYVFDHHERSQELLGEGECYVEIQRSGTKIIFDYLTMVTGVKVSRMVKEFVDLVDVYDRYDDTSPLWQQAQDLNRVFWQVISYYQSGLNKFRPFLQRQEGKFSVAGDNGFTFTPYEETAIAKAKAKEEIEYNLALRNAQRRVDEKGHTYLMWHGSSKISIVCYRILQNFADLDYIVNINTYTGKPTKEVNGKVSVRGRKGFDVTQLEGINGHVAAGGGIFEVSRIKEIWFKQDQHFKYKLIE